MTIRKSQGILLNWPKQFSKKNLKRVTENAAGLLGDCHKLDFPY